MKQVLKLLFLLLLFAAPVYSQGVRYDNFVVKPLAAGGLQAVSGALITVCTSAGTGTPCTPKVANIYSDEALTTPITGTGGAGTTNSDSFGNYGFYIAPGDYVLTITGSGITSSTVKLTLPCGVVTGCTVSGTTTLSNENGELHVCPTCTNTTIAAAQTALPSVGGTIWVDNNAVLDSSTVTISKPIHVIFDVASYSSAATGSLFACTTGTEGVHIEGSNRGGAGITQGTLISLTNNATIGFNFTNCPGTLIERLTLLGPNTGGTGKGIILSGTRPTLRQLLVSQFGSDGVTIDGTTNNTNLAEVDHVRAQNNGGHGFKTLGANANVILFNGADAGGNTGDGFNIASAGNAFIGTNTSGNGTGGIGNGYHFLSGANNNWGFTFSDAPNGNENTGYRWDAGANNNMLFTTADAGAAPVVNNGSGNRYLSAPSTMNSWTSVQFTASATGACPGASFIFPDANGWYEASANDERFCQAGADFLRFLTTGPILTSNGVYAFGSSGVGSPDTGWSRSAAGVAALGNGTQGNTSGSWAASNYRALGAPAAVAGLSSNGYDSTTGTEQHNSNNNGASSFSGAWNCTNVTPVTVNANVATDQNLMACTIPAGTLNRVGRSLQINIAGVYSTVAASTASLTYKVKLCTISGCGSGTVITLASIATGTTGALTAASFPFNITLQSTTQTAGASSAYEAHGRLVIDITSALAADSVFADSNIATVGTIDDTVQLFLQVTAASASASASNSWTQRQLIAQTIN